MNELNLDQHDFWVFLISLKKRHVRRKRRNNPDFPNLHILIKDSSNLEAALARDGRARLEALGLKNPGKFKRILCVDGFHGFESKLEAYRFAYDWQNKMRNERRKVKVHSDSDSPTCSIYCIKLKPEVWHDKTFRNSNAHIEDGEPEPDAFYVGQTCAPRIHRLLQHIDPDSNKSTRWGLQYFDYDEQDPKGLAEEMEQGLMLAEKWSSETGKAINGLTQGQSLLAEADLATWLQSRGYGAYFA